MGRGTLAALVCSAVLLLAGVGLFGLSIVLLTAPPRDSAHAFLGHMRAGRDDVAWNSTTRGFQGAVPRTEFSRMMGTHFPAVARSTDATFNSTTISGGVACLSGSMETPQGRVPLHVRLMHERDRWRVEELGAAPVSGCSASGFSL
jgi:hypothetical protein